MHSHLQPSRTPRSSRGAAAVELAVALPLVTLLLAGGMDLGRVAAASIVLNNATAAAAAYAASHRITSQNEDSWEQAVNDAVVSEMQNLRSFDASKLAVQTSSQVLSSGEIKVVISAEYTVPPVIPWPGLPSTFHLRHSVTAIQYR